jgi:hypothetical protein
MSTAQIHKGRRGFMSKILFVSGSLLMTLVKETSDKGRATKILLGRVVKDIAHRIGIYNEDFPTYQHYEAPEFDPRHF